MNKLSLALLSIVFVSAAHAQTTNTTSVNTSTTDIDLDSAMIDDLSNDRTQFQLRAGLGLGRLPKSSAGDAASGLNVAALIDLPVASGTTFLTGINYVQKSTSLGGSDLRVNYLVIPVQMKAHFGHPRSFRWSVGLGPYVGIKTASYHSTTSQDATGISSYDIGGRGSLGLELPIQARTSILAGADFDQGLNDIGGTRMRALLLTVGLGVEI